MGDCGSYKAKVKVMVKPKEGNLVLKNPKYLFNYDDYGVETCWERVKKYEQDFIVGDLKDEIIEVKWKDVYKNLSLKEFEQEFGEEVFNYFYKANVYLLEDVLVDEEQYKNLQKFKVDELLDDKYYNIGVDDVCEYIYCDNDNSSFENITKKLLEVVDFCKENDYKFEVILEGDGYCNC